MSVLDRFKIEGRVALVTGGSKGLGYEMAKALAEAGADVAICSRNLVEAQQAASEIASATGRRIFGYECDVVNKSSIEKLATDIQRDLGVVDKIGRAHV